MITWPFLSEKKRPRKETISKSESEVNPDSDFIYNNLFML